MDQKDKESSLFKDDPVADVKNILETLTNALFSSDSPLFSDNVLQPAPDGEALLPEKFYLLKVEVLYWQPVTWRRILISSHKSLVDLHHKIQELFLWEGGHLYGFFFPRGKAIPEYLAEHAEQKQQIFEGYCRLNRTMPVGIDPLTRCPIFAPKKEFRMDSPDFLEYFEDVAKYNNELTYNHKLCTVFRDQIKKKLEYTYDFGENWDHKITLEKVLNSPDELSKRFIMSKGELIDHYAKEEWDEEE